MPPAIYLAGIFGGLFAHLNMGEAGILKTVKTHEGSQFLGTF